MHVPAIRRETRADAAAVDLGPEALSPERIADLLKRIGTAGLCRGNAPTVALVVVNPARSPISQGVAVFPARFPVRESVGAQPVTVRDEAGRVVPSRLVNESLDPAGAPPGRVWWTLKLRFLIRDVPARGWRTYAATYGDHPDSHVADEQTWRTAAAAPAAMSSPLAIYETDGQRRSACDRLARPGGWMTRTTAAIRRSRGCSCGNGCVPGTLVRRSQAPCRRAIAS